ncbi:MAG: hypothetical protein PHD37_17420 [Gallionellaceae bacterium]|nr:hypothetical protein [Gallionellaceae bacterium]
MIGAETIKSDFECAKLALGYIGEWAKWMSGIQTAAIGGLGAIAYNADKLQVAYAAQERHWIIAAFLLLSVALLLNAWVLSSVASIALRLDKLRGESTLDIYEAPSFTWFGGRNITLGFLMGLQHWAWGLGLASFAAFCLRHF